MTSFFVVRTLPDAESRVADALRRKSRDVYFPQVRVERHHARRIQLVVRPFLPCRLFVADDQRGVADIVATRGVAGVLLRNGEPVRKSQAFINAMMRREDDDGFVVLISAPMANLVAASASVLFHKITPSFRTALLDCAA